MHPAVMLTICVGKVKVIVIITVNVKMDSSVGLITVGMVGLIILGIVVPQVSIKVTLKIKDQEFH